MIKQYNAKHIEKTVRHVVNISISCNCGTIVNPNIKDETNGKTKISKNFILYNN